MGVGQSSEDRWSGSLRSCKCQSSGRRAALLEICILRGADQCRQRRFAFEISECADGFAPNPRVWVGERFEARCERSLDAQIAQAPPRRDAHLGKLVIDEGQKGRRGVRRFQLCKAQSCGGHVGTIEDRVNLERAHQLMRVARDETGKISSDLGKAPLRDFVFAGDLGRLQIVVHEAPDLVFHLIGRQAILIVQRCTHTGALHLDVARVVLREVR